ncbi:phosphatidylinositol-specific phospholipase C/glycerophosphodiester phosphodiesterase family protein [Paenibacillus cymbidii]|uniref:phosphatidylinositol-specific phospholipase C/glycerophosphodiester phosphodiesterase family protein n=1 Tax=Paenibacillus cymbidii TaxID=1639034 RepID=UPI0010805C98|nr:phosphatidylinositol-specific phospholipase C/glycerophosphodiester phosphodiesterase family protein [Paenibacillus cymbidii]
MNGKWKRWPLAALLIGSLLTGGTAALADSIAPASADWTSNRMIAHAMGGIDGEAYTNSLDAFERSYKRGYRVFEVDLLLTDDDKLAARHDWSEDVQPGLPDDLIGDSISLAEFKEQPILDKYKPLSFRDIVRLMLRYPDIRIVTDTKETDVDLVRTQFEYMKRTAAMIDLSVLDRIIPELYTPEMYDAVMAIYPFPDKLYSLYLNDSTSGEVVRFVREHQIRTVAMPVNRALLDPFLVRKLNDAGVMTYVHAVNNKLEMKLLLSLGVYGVYSDFLANDADYYTGYIELPIPRSESTVLLYALLATTFAAVVRRMRENPLGLR